jgi:hypothetical protein
MTISSGRKNEFLLALGARRLQGVTFAVLQAIVEHINPILGVAFAAYGKYAREGGRTRRTAMRTIPQLCRLGILKQTRRDGPPILWFPELMDMDAAEAVRRTDFLIRNRGKDPDAYFREAGPENGTPHLVGRAENGTPLEGGAKNGTSGGARNGTHNLLIPTP